MKIEREKEGNEDSYIGPEQLTTEGLSLRELWVVNMQKRTRHTVLNVQFGVPILL